MPMTITHQKEAMMADHQQLPPIGSEQTVTITGQLNDRIYEAEPFTDQLDWAVRVYTRDGEQFSQGDRVKPWVFRYRPDRRELHLSVDEFGRMPISESMASRYLRGCDLMLTLLRDGWKSEGGEVDMEVLGEARGMLSRCIKRDQKDWFSVWVALGRPARKKMERVRDELYQLKAAIKREDVNEVDDVLLRLEESGAEDLYSSAQKRIERGLQGDSNSNCSTESDAGPDEAIVETEKSEFDPNTIATSPSQKSRNVTTRPGQAQFRRQVKDAYSRHGAVTGCSVEKVLEAAHIHDFSGADSNAVSNGLLLRADIHRLFDAGLLTIDENYRVLISTELEKTDYEQFEGKPIRLPSSPSARPSKKCLVEHREKVFGAG